MIYFYIYTVCSLVYLILKFGHDNKWEFSFLEILNSYPDVPRWVKVFIVSSMAVWAIVLSFLLWPFMVVKYLFTREF